MSGFSETMTFKERLNDGWLWAFLTLSNGFVLWTSIKSETGYPIVQAILLGITIGCFFCSPMMKRIFGKDC